MLLLSIVTAVHIIVCIILVLVVLLQSGKSADLAGAFGGGATQTAFGSRGPASLLSKMTTISAIVFMLTSIGLSMISAPTASKSVLEGKIEETAQPDAGLDSEKSGDEVLTPDQIKKRVEELATQKQEKSDSGETAPAEEPNTP